MLLCIGTKGQGPFYFCTITVFWEVKTVANSKRTKITLACTECKHRNYFLTKEKKAHPDRMELSKYCRFCKKHTPHKETK